MSGFSRSSILSRSLLLLSLSSMASLLTSFAIILPRVHRWTNTLFIKYPVYRSHSVYNVTLRRIQNLDGFFYRIFLFTLRAQRDAPTYTKTTDQCGARSGSPQLIINYLYIQRPEKDDVICDAIYIILWCHNIKFWVGYLGLSCDSFIKKSLKTQKPLKWL